MKGKTIVGYTLLKLLGKGGMAEVWYAENSIGKKAAIKVLLPKFCADENVVARFQTEAKVMVELSHLNIRQVYHYGTIDGRPTIVMEYLDGDDLKARMKAGQHFTDEELIKWWNQLVDALNYTHSKGVIHRDIKPGNIFVDNNGNIKLLDFGIAKVRESISMTQTGAMMGTLMYMSPEQVDDSKHVSFKSDIYSLAVTFVHLLTGKAPYDSDKNSDLSIRMSIFTKPLDISDVPELWQRFLAPYLEKKPENRPELRYFDVVAETQIKQTPKNNESFVDEETVPATPSTINEHAITNDKTIKKNKVGLWIAMAVVAIIIVMTVSLLPDEETKAFNACETISNYRLYVSNYGKDARHYAEAMKIVDNFVSDSVQNAPFEFAKTISVKGVSFNMIPIIGYVDKDYTDKDSSKAYYIGQCEVTQKLWTAVMGTNPSHFKGDNLPVECVDWYDAVEFCNRLSKQCARKPYYIIDSIHVDLDGFNYYDRKKYEVTINEDSDGFRLPTESEWKYAASVGFKGNGNKYSGSDSINDVAWYTKTTSDIGTKPVGTKLPNELGIYDMSGNVWEWCYDLYEENDKDPCRVLCGGSWNSISYYCNVSYRLRGGPTNSGRFYGFRLALSMNEAELKKIVEASNEKNNIFSVSPNNKVQFSKGNLQYQASTKTWRFAEHQWDIMGYENSKISSSYNGWIDLFGWGTSGYNGKNPWMTRTSSTDYGNGEKDIAGTNYDWGVYNTISNGGGKSWRTLTRNEWVYVFNIRSTSSGIRYTKATVNGVNGVILLPDNWRSSNYSLSNTNNKDAGFSSNRISQTDWTNKLEANGAVFLPAAGWYDGTLVYSVGISGSYWSASYSRSNGAIMVWFTDDNLGQEYFGYRNYGQSVRLVCPAEN